MKFSFAFLVLPFLLISCDNPQRTRYPRGDSSSNGVNSPQNSSTNNPTWTTSSTTFGPENSGNNPSQSSTSPKPPGFETCDLTAKYYAAAIGYMGICQSTLDEEIVMASSTLTDTNRTCLIPTYKDATGSSTYLGRAQCFLPKQNETTTGKIYKSRPGFSSYSINGVMIMKEASLSAYFTCMDAYATFSAQPSCPYGARTNAYCEQQARAYMATKCNSFKNDHPYIDVRLKN